MSMKERVLFSNNNIRTKRIQSKRGRASGRIFRRMKECVKDSVLSYRKFSDRRTSITVNIFFKEISYIHFFPFLHRSLNFLKQSSSRIRIRKSTLHFSSSHLSSSFLSKSPTQRKSGQVKPDP